jgi:glycosyl transferase family 25
MQELPIYVINLKKNTERKKYLIEEFKKHKIENYNFIEAINGNDLNSEELKNKNIISNNCKLTRGEIGCSLSHYKIYEEIIKNDAEISLVLEDDVFFVDGFNIKYNILMNRIKNINWDIFYLGINCYTNCCKEGEYVGNKIHGIYYPKHVLAGTHGYLIKKQSIKKIMDCFFPIHKAVDIFLMNIDIKRFTLTNTIIKTNNTYSETQNII